MTYLIFISNTTGMARSKALEQFIVDRWYYQNQNKEILPQCTFVLGTFTC